MSEHPEFVSWKQLSNWAESYNPGVRKKFILDILNNHAAKDARIERLTEYVEHTKECIRSFWHAGRPTKDGGYETNFRGKWYQSKPVNEEPKCDCGLEQALEGNEKTN